MISAAAYRTELGIAFNSDLENFLASVEGRALRGKVKLLFTSPPFPLRAKKAYGNLQGSEYVEWLSNLMTHATEVLAPDGSLVIEIGNAWDHGQPTMSLLPLQTLLAIVEKSGFSVCQQFICHNPTRLPGPAQWVTVNRWRVKDSYTHVWWLAKDPRTIADNRRVLEEYSPSMKRLIRTKKYNAGKRPSGHDVSEQTFSVDHGGAIPSNVLSYSNSTDDTKYREWCKSLEVPLHPARMQKKLPEFFIRFLTDPGDLVMDCFAGSNTTGHVAEVENRRWVGVERDPNYLLGSLGRFIGPNYKLTGLNPQFVSYVTALENLQAK